MFLTMIEISKNWSWGYKHFAHPNGSHIDFQFLKRLIVANISEGVLGNYNFDIYLSLPVKYTRVELKY